MKINIRFLFEISPFKPAESPFFRNLSHNISVLQPTQLDWNLFVCVKTSFIFLILEFGSIFLFHLFQFRAETRIVVTLWTDLLWIVFMMLIMEVISVLTLLKQPLWLQKSGSVLVGLWGIWHLGSPFNNYENLKEALRSLSPLKIGWAFFAILRGSKIHSAEEGLKT